MTRMAVFIFVKVVVGLFLLKRRRLGLTFYKFEVFIESFRFVSRHMLL